jgi:hypothetical protein
VTQTTIAVTILHIIHYGIEVPKTKTDYWFSKYNRVLHHYYDRTSHSWKRNLHELPLVKRPMKFSNKFLSIINCQKSCSKYQLLNKNNWTSHFYWWITYYIFFTIQYNIGFRNKRNAYINPFPKKTHEKLQIVIQTYSITYTI